MIALVQRVTQARVVVDGATVGAIDTGLLVFVCSEPADTAAHAERLVAKLLALRIFADAAGKMNLNLQDVGGGLLLVSQFTLAADTSRGNRPSFTNAAPPEQANELYELFCREIAQLGVRVEKGVFGAHMAVRLLNDGPVTICLDTDDWKMG